jgi:hypothetical protein
MRAICGAIITAGSLIGLGLLGVGIGTRYQNFSERGQDGTIEFLHFKGLDTPLMLILVFLIATTLIGLGISFLGLAYHHFRRHHEHLRAFPPHDSAGAPRATV